MKQKLWTVDKMFFNFTKFTEPCPLNVKEEEIFEETAVILRIDLPDATPNISAESQQMKRRVWRNIIIKDRIHRDSVNSNYRIISQSGTDVSSDSL